MTEKYKNKLMRCLKALKNTETNKLYEKLLDRWIKNKNIFICGNGGSGANANHIANDLIYGAGKKNKKGLKIESLVSNNAVLTCLANDEGYENIFSEQLKVKGNKDDLLIVLSGSGNSKNIINVVKEAKKNNIETFALVGFNGGKCKKIVDNFIHCKINDMQVSEDMQMIIFNICIQRLMKKKILVVDN